MCKQILVFTLHNIVKIFLHHAKHFNGIFNTKQLYLNIFYLILKNIEFLWKSGLYYSIHM